VYLAQGSLSATVTLMDGDNDTVTSEALDISGRVSFDDDGPTFISVMDAVISSATEISFNGLYDASFGADGLDFLSVALGAGGTYGGEVVTFEQIDKGAGVSQVDVTNGLNEVLFSFYYTTTTNSVSGGGAGGVIFDAFSSLANPDSSEFFTLTVNPDGTYTFDMISNTVISSTTVNGNDFSAEGPSGSKATPDGSLTVYAGDADPAIENVNASNLGLGIGQPTISEGEWLLLDFEKQQTAISFKMVQWGGGGSVVVSMLIGGVQFDFDQSAPGIQNLLFDKPGSNPTMAVVVDANQAGEWTYAGGIYTLYVANSFDEVKVENVVTDEGNVKFGVNTITYDQEVHVQDLALNFSLSATDLDGDTATLGDQLTVVMNDPDITLSAYTAGVDADDGVVLVGNGENDTLIGGDGDDLLIGDMGHDTYIWLPGATGTDTVQGLTANYNGVPEGDRLDLSQLLDGENGAGPVADLFKFLDVQLVGSDTVINVSTTGLFSATDGNPHPVTDIDQSIVLKNTDLFATYGANEADVISGMLGDGTLEVDTV